MNQEALGPAEKIIQTLLAYNDHMAHGRAGVIVPDTRFGTGVRWEPVTHKVENNVKIVYRLDKHGRKTVKTKIGVLHDDKSVRLDNGTRYGTYRKSGLFREVAVWFYRQIAEIWKMDNEFAARWASYAYKQEHRDLKVLLAAFMLVQSRSGAPVMDNGKLAFYDENYRAIGEAMILLHEKNEKNSSSKDHLKNKAKDDKDTSFSPKLLLRVAEVLSIPEIAQINRELGFGNSTRKPFLGRWTKAVEMWLRYRENNPKMLNGLVKAGLRTTVISLAQKIGYKPTTPKFFETLRWKQKQADDGRRSIIIGQEVAKAESWDKLNEKQICVKITKDKPSWKRVVGLLPTKIGVTRAIVAAAIEAGSFSNQDLIIFTPTLEELGLLEVPTIKKAWEAAVATAENTRAANIALNVKSKATQEKLVEAADNAVKEAVKEVVKGIRIYLMVDKSGSMEQALEAAKEMVSRFAQGFPLNQIHIAVFDTAGREITVRHASSVGVKNAFEGIRASGGTDYGAGIRVLQSKRPNPDEDVIFIFVGDEEASPFDDAVRASGLNPLAFGFLKTIANGGAAGWRANTYGVDRNIAVRETANRLKIPCFMIDGKTFEDVYAIPRTIRALIAATPVAVTSYTAPVAKPRKSLVETILSTDLLQKPSWAIAAPLTAIAVATS